jgi:enamine deaminase RidA (YjgF/YER057c/UK114 family)
LDLVHLFHRAFHHSRPPGDVELLSWCGEESGDPHDSAAHAYAALAKAIAESGSAVLQERIFTQIALSEHVLEIRATALRKHGVDLPVAPTCIEGTPTGGNGFAGVHVMAVRSPTEVLPVERDGVTVGQVISSRDAQYLGLSDVGRLLHRPENINPTNETRLLFVTLEELLGSVGWSFQNVLRTWFYLRDILDWYDEFNLVRNEAFQRIGLFDANVIPASTGIRGRGLSGCWATVDLIAMRGLDSEPLSVRRLANPQQNEAPEYGSAFSRGMEIAVNGSRMVFVSGTAAIDDHGLSVHEGNFEAQVRHTLDTIGALLGEADAGLEDISQATAFIKRPEDLATYQDLVSRLRLGDLPQIISIGDVCRPELLFEMDATAVLPGG